MQHVVPRAYDVAIACGLDINATASPVLNRKPGIMLWSTLPAANPFGGGTLCLASPIVHTLGQASGGSPAPSIDCTGRYSFHFGHAYIQNYFLTAGQTIRAQYWIRDSGFAAPNNIGLIDGLSFTLLPKGLLEPGIDSSPTAIPYTNDGPELAPRPARGVVVPRVPDAR